MGWDEVERREEVNTRRGLGWDGMRGGGDANAG